MSKWGGKGGALICLYFQVFLNIEMKKWNDIETIQMLLSFFMYLQKRSRPSVSTQTIKSQLATNDGESANKTALSPLRLADLETGVVNCWIWVKRLLLATDILVG